MFLINNNKENVFNHFCEVFRGIINLYGIKTKDEYSLRISDVYFVLAEFIDGFAYINNKIDDKEIFKFKLNSMIDKRLNNVSEYSSMIKRFKEKQMEFITNNIVDISDIQKDHRDFFNKIHEYILKLDKNFIDENLIESAMDKIDTDLFYNEKSDIKKCFFKMIIILIFEKYAFNKKLFIPEYGIFEHLKIVFFDFESDLNWCYALQKSDFTLRLKVYITSLEKTHKFESDEDLY